MVSLITLCSVLVSLILDRSGLGPSWAGGGSPWLLSGPGTSDGRATQTGHHDELDFRVSSICLSGLYPTIRSRPLFGMLRLDPETVLILLTTTRIPGRFYRIGTVVGPCSVNDLRSCAVTSTVTTKPLFPVLDLIGTEDNKPLRPRPIEVVPQVHPGAS